MLAPQPSPCPSWQAHIELQFARRGPRTAIVGRRHAGPLRIQRPFYPEGEVCHTYLLHPPGGVVGGDELSIDLAVAEHGHALLTTPGAAKFYRSAGALASQRQHFKVGAGATLEWLPQDTILFSGSEVHSQCRIDLTGDARFIGWELLCFGRPAGAAPYDAGRCRQGLALYRDDAPLVIERGHYEAGGALMGAAWGLQGHSVSGTLLASGADTETLERARRVALPETAGRLACTLMEDVLVCRVLSHHAEPARHAFIHIWQAIRPRLLGREASPPRIWNT